MQGCVYLHTPASWASHELSAGELTKWMEYCWVTAKAVSRATTLCQNRSKIIKVHLPAEKSVIRLWAEPVAGSSRRVGSDYLVAPLAIHYLNMPHYVGIACRAYGRQSDVEKFERGTSTQSNLRRLVFAG